MKLINAIIIMVLGFLTGSVVGEILGLILPEKYLQIPLFARGVMTGFNPVNLNLKVIEIVIGIKLLTNTFSWIGLFIASTALVIKEIAGKQ
jgi:hypothetical protein